MSIVAVIFATKDLVISERIIIFAPYDAESNTFDTSKGQLVVKLNEDGLHNVVTYQGLIWEQPKNEFARDLLNNADHNDVAAGRTFTTHMLLADDGSLSCLPIALSGATEFDIRYLRPLSANTLQPALVVDAKDGGTYIDVAQLAEYIDWRDVRFQYTNINYLNYYGVKRLKVNFEKAKTNLAGQDNVGLKKNAAGEVTGVRALTAEEIKAAKEWPLLTDVSKKLQFVPNFWADEEIEEGATSYVDADGVTHVCTCQKGV